MSRAGQWFAYNNNNNIQERCIYTHFHDFYDSLQRERVD